MGSIFLAACDVVTLYHWHKCWSYSVGYSLLLFFSRLLPGWALQLSPFHPGHLNLRAACRTRASSAVHRPPLSPRGPLVDLLRVRPRSCVGKILGSPGKFQRREQTVTWVEPFFRRLPSCRFLARCKPDSRSHALWSPLTPTVKWPFQFLRLRHASGVRVLLSKTNSSSCFTPVQLQLFEIVCHFISGTSTCSSWRAAGWDSVTPPPSTIYKGTLKTA